MKSKQKGSKKKGTDVSGEVQLQFALFDPTNPLGSRDETFQKFIGLAAINAGDEGDTESGLSRQGSFDPDDDDDSEDDKELESEEETDDPTKPGISKKRERKHRIAKLKRKTKARAYEFAGGSDVVGIIFLEISKITDLPPERNSGFRAFIQSLQTLMTGSDEDFL